MKKENSTGSLSEAIDWITHHYPQAWIEQDDVDINTGRLFRKKYPRYLFRGEEDHTWPATTSSFSREQQKLAAFFEEWNHWIAGRHLSTAAITNRSSLYFFLREAIWEISSVEESFESFRYDQPIAAIMQHYGIPSAFIDLTSDPFVAAHFARGAAVLGTIGQLMVLPTDNLEFQLFDLSVDPRARPNRQKGFALLLPSQMDLKNAEFRKAHHVSWIKFQLTAEDINQYFLPEVLSVHNDCIAVQIMQWFGEVFSRDPSVSTACRSYMATRLQALGTKTN